MENIINENLDLDKLRKEFLEKKYVVISDYLKEDVANMLHDFLSYEMPADWWSIASYPSPDSDGVNYIRNFEENYEEAKKYRDYAEQKFAEGQFSYTFHRTLDNHVEGCECQECEFRKFLDSNENCEIISKITNLDIKGANELFAACYLPGDFLSPHQDSPNGIIGFVYQLTKDWKPQYGGLLHFLNDDGDVIESVEVPEFNSLTLFLLPEDKGKLHYVSHVNPKVDELRLSFTGWFRN